MSCLGPPILHVRRLGSGRGIGWRSPGCTPVSAVVTFSSRGELTSGQLTRTGRRTVPLLVVFDHHGQPIFSSDFFTIQEVIQALDQAGNAGR